MGEQPKQRADKGRGGLYQKTTKEWNERAGEYQLRTYWQASQDITTDEIGKDGKPKRKRITGSGATKQLAQKKLQSNLAKHFQLPFADEQPKQRRTKDTLTLGAWLDEWHESVIKRKKVSETVLRKYKSNYELHIVPYLGDVPLKELNAKQLENLFENVLPEKTKVVQGVDTGKLLLGSSAQRNIYKTLNTALKRAVASGHLDRNPLALVEAPVMTRPEENVPQEAHKAQALLAHMKNDDHPDYVRFLLMFLGLRRSERLGLTWSNIKNLGQSDAKMVINQQLARYENGDGYYINPRTKMGNPRTIPIPEPFLSALRQHKKKMAKLKKSPQWNPEPAFADLVFLNDDGSLITQNRDNLDWHAVLKHYRFNYWRAHLNRHITATLLADQQPPVSIAVVQELLGNGEAMAYYYARVTSKAMKVPLETYGETAFPSLMGDVKK